MSLMKSATPFKIHDENQFASQIKPGKSGGGLKSAGTDGPLKKGLSAVKSTRKGLSTLTASQINTRLTTPAHSINIGKAKQSTTVKETQKVKFKIADKEDYYVDDFQQDEMYCTRLAAEVDLFDMSTPANPHFMPEIRTGDTSWMDLPLSPTVKKPLEEPLYGFDIGDYEFDEPDHLQHFESLANAPLMDLSGYED